MKYYLRICDSIVRVKLFVVNQIIIFQVIFYGKVLPSSSCKLLLTNK